MHDRVRPIRLLLAHACCKRPLVIGTDSLLYPATFAAKIAEVFVVGDVGTFEWDFVTTTALTARSPVSATFA